MATATSMPRMSIEDVAKKAVDLCTNGMTIVSSISPLPCEPITWDDLSAETQVDVLNEAIKIIRMTEKRMVFNVHV